MDVVLAFPFLLFAIALVSIVGPGLGVAIVVIAFFPGRRSPASCAARCSPSGSGSTSRRRARSARATCGSCRRHLPNLIAPVIVYVTLLMPAAIVFEATLSFLGLGVVPPTATWGKMLAESLQLYRVAWWIVVVPGLALLVTTLAFNLLGDSVRDAFDPRGERLVQEVVMVRFLVRRILLGAGRALGDHDGRVRAVLRRAAATSPALIAGRQATPETSR